MVENATLDLISISVIIETIVNKTKSVSPSLGPIFLTVGQTLQLQLTSQSAVIHLKSPVTFKMDSNLSIGCRPDRYSGDEKRTDDSCGHGMTPPTWEEVASYYIWNKSKELHPRSKGPAEGIMKGMKRMHFNDGGGEDEGHKAKKQLHGVVSQKLSKIWLASNLQFRPRSRASSHQNRRSRDGTKL